MEGCPGKGSVSVASDHKLEIDTIQFLVFLYLGVQHTHLKIVVFLGAHTVKFFPWWFRIQLKLPSNTSLGEQDQNHCNSICEAILVELVQ